MSALASQSDYFQTTPGGMASRAYPDPFITYATSLMPQAIEDVLRWCDSLWAGTPTYAQAIRQVTRYFITKIMIEDASLDEKDKWDEVMNDDLRVPYILPVCGDDFMVYGNSFSSVYVPFYRTLRCHHEGCGVERPIEQVDYRFNAFEFSWKCQYCKNECKASKPNDRKRSSHDRKGLYIKRWNPHEIRIRWHPVSGKKLYLWDAPADVIRLVKAGDQFTINDMPWEMILAIKERKLFQFADNVIFHMCEESPAGIRSRGWGVSRFMTNFSQAYHVKILKMSNEVLATDHILPFRVITPMAAGREADPLLHANIGNVNSRIQGMIRQHRKHPGGWYSLPFPVQYQALSGEGLKADISPLIEQAVDEMLCAAGVPAELYKGTLQIQAAPMALRLFQQAWIHLTMAYDGWINWLVTTLSDVFNWEPITARLQPVTLADDIEKRQLLLQLAASNKVSMSTALAPLGIEDANEEVKRVFDEQRSFAEQQTKFQQDQQNKAQLTQNMQSSALQAAGGQPQAQQGGDDDSGGGQSSNASVDELMSQADNISQQLIAMNDSQRRSELLKLKRSNETLWSLVKSRLETKRNQARSTGGQQVLAQQAGQAAQQGQVNQG